MSERKALYHCRQCGHDFDKLPSVESEDLNCPRCDSTDIEKSPYLFGTPECSGLSPEDYFETCLAPCCTPNWLGWKHHFSGVDNWDYVLPQKKDKDSTRSTGKIETPAEEPEK